MDKSKTVTVHTNVDKNVLELFDKMYPTCRTRLIQNVLYLCTTKKEIFDKIFFYELLKDSNLAL